MSAFEGKADIREKPKKTQSSGTQSPLYGDMTYFYLPPTSLKYIDAKPLEARYLALIALIKIYIDIGRHREMERAPEN